MPIKSNQPGKHTTLREACNTNLVSRYPEATDGANKRAVMLRYITNQRLASQLDLEQVYSTSYLFSLTKSKVFESDW
jgi:hypothetical protein